MKPYIIMSDLHFHNWSQFATTNSDMVNSRLQNILDAVDYAIECLVAKGGNRVYIAGDVFHTRGAVQTSVLNPVLSHFKRQINKGIEFRIIPGNHDLGTKDTHWIGNAIQSLEGIGCEVITAPTIFPDDKVVMFPWYDDLDKLRLDMKVKYTGGYSAIIHAPLNDVIRGIPNLGFDPADLETIGYRRIYVGHYHNHKNFNNRVYSIGSLTHQTWSDVNSTSGFILEADGIISHLETKSPKFVDSGGISPVLENNYIRHTTNTSNAAKIEQFRKSFYSKGALGVQIKSEPVVEFTRTVKSKGDNPTLVESMSSWADENIIKDKEKILIEANKILGDVL